MKPFKDKKIIKLGKEDIENFKTAGTLECPICKTLMAFIETKDKIHSEFYCKQCQISAPLVQE